MKWRYWNHILHRDIGYLCIGLTVIYAISGILVNHLSHDFNPSYTIKKYEQVISPLPEGSTPDTDYIQQALNELAIDEPFKNGAMLSPDSIRIFTDDYTVDINLISGKSKVEFVSQIPVAYEFNYLHLNKGKGIWTIIADIYAVALFLLAITGVLMIKGKRKTRPIVLTILGIALPLIYVLFFIT